MDMGELFYIFILFALMILGIFNDSRKKKEKQKQQGDSPPVRKPLLPTLFETFSPPPPPKVAKKAVGRVNNKYESELEKWQREREARLGKLIFRSSLDRSSDFGKESTLFSDSYTPISDEANIFHSIFDSPDSPEPADISSYPVHPLIGDLLEDRSGRELIKGLIYGEILQRKY